MFATNYISTVIIVVASIITGSYLVYSNPVSQRKCSEELFPKPYVIRYASKAGTEMARMESLGIIDLRDAIKGYICVNGPAILYKNAQTSKDSSGGPAVDDSLKHIIKTNPGETVDFLGGTFQVFNHQCMKINWVSEGSSPDKIFDKNSKVEVHGWKVAGIFLIASAEANASSPSPLKILFNKKGLGYSIGSKDEISDASFVATGKGPYCLTLPNESKVMISSNSAQDDSEICRWALEEDEKSNNLYKRFFRKHFKRADYKWEECGDENKDDANNATTKNHTGFIHDPFATYKNPNAIVSKGSLPSSTSSPATESEFSGSAEEPDGSGHDGGNGNSKIFPIELSNCVSIPKFEPKDPSCEFAKSSEECPKLAAALDLVEMSAGDKNAPAPEPEQEAAPSSISSLENDPKLKWKHDVLVLVAKIFSKICIPIKPQSVHQLMRVINNYIATAHSDGIKDFRRVADKSEIWDILIARLNHCKSNKTTKAMEWEWKTPSLNVPTTGERKKREAEAPPPSKDQQQVLEKIVLESEDEDGDFDNKRLIIQRSIPVFDFDDEDEATNELWYGAIPRWTRNSPDLENIQLPFIQEYVAPLPEPSHGLHKMTHQDFIIFPGEKNLRIKGNYSNKLIFYYHDASEVIYELNTVIDSFWKVLATVMGYCQRYEIARRNGIYPLLFHKFEEYFLNLLKDQWRNPDVPQELEMIAGEFLDEDRHQWLDTCLETSYIVSKSLRFRPPRPIELDMEPASNSSLRIKSNSFLYIPEQSNDKDKYFIRLPNFEDLEEA